MINRQMDWITLDKVASHQYRIKIRYEMTIKLICRDYVWHYHFWNEFEKTISWNCFIRFRYQDNRPALLKFIWICYWQIGMEFTTYIMLVFSVMTVTFIPTLNTKIIRFFFLHLRHLKNKPAWNIHLLLFP